MTRGRRLAAIFLLVTLGALAAVATLRREPRYAGHPLSFWLSANSTFANPRRHQPQQDVDAAIRAIGPAAVPHLVRWVSYEPSAGKMRVILGLRRCAFGTTRVARLIPNALLWDHQEALAIGARHGFTILGPAASSAAPALLRRLRVAHDAQAMHRMVGALDAIGPDGALALAQFAAGANAATAAGRAAMLDAIGLLGAAVQPTRTTTEALARCAISNDGAVSAQACRALRSCGGSPEIAVPALIRALQHRDPRAREAAALALSTYGEQASSAVDSLQAELTDPDNGVRAAAQTALEFIVPGAQRQAAPPDWDRVGAPR